MGRSIGVHGVKSLDRRGGDEKYMLLRVEETDRTLRYAGPSIHVGRLHFVMGPVYRMAGFSPPTFSPQG